MSRTILRAAAALVAALTLVVTLFGATATATEPYPPVPPPAPVVPDTIPVDQLLCLRSLGLGTGTSISAIVQNPDGSLTVTITLGSKVNTAQCPVSNVVVEYNPVVYAGPVPASKTLNVSVPSCASPLTVTYNLVNSAKFSEKLGLSGPACAAPVAVPVPADQLAFTGSDMSLPVSAAAVFIGAGGLLLYGANRRGRRFSD